MMEIMQFLLKTYRTEKSHSFYFKKQDTTLAHNFPKYYSDVNKTTRFKTKTKGHKTKTTRLKTKTEKFGLKTKTIGPITTYSLPTVNEIIFYSTIFYNLCTLSTS